MTSIEDIVNASYRIRSSSEEVQTRTLMCADSLRRHGTQLQAVIRGSRTGQEAVQQVTTAEREVRQCAAQLLALQANIDRFIRDITK